MSHFGVLIITKEKDDAVDVMSPYDENRVVAPYVPFTLESKAQERAKKINKYIDILALPEEKRKEYRIEAVVTLLKQLVFKTDEEYYNYYAGDYEYKNKNGEPVSTYNPDSKWDYWGEHPWLLLKSGEKVSSAEKKDIDIEEIKNKPFFAYVKDGKWFEKGQMGWWAMVSNEKDDDEWQKEWEEMIDKISDDAVLTSVDCHI